MLGNVYSTLNLHCCEDGLIGSCGYNTAKLEKEYNPTKYPDNHFQRASQKLEGSEPKAPVYAIENPTSG